MTWLALFLKLFEAAVMLLPDSWAYTLAMLWQRIANLIDPADGMPATMFLAAEAPPEFRDGVRQKLLALAAKVENRAARWVFEAFINLVSDQILNLCYDYIVSKPAPLGMTMTTDRQMALDFIREPVDTEAKPKPTVAATVETK